LSYCNAAQEVYAEGPLYCIETATRRQAVTLRGDAGVVDENVEMSEICLDLPGGGGNDSAIVKVDADILDIAAFTFERGCCLLPECLVARTEEKRTT
jgi:hypothetical protein